MNNGNRSAVTFHDDQELSLTSVERGPLFITIDGYRAFDYSSVVDDEDDPPIGDPALEELIVDDPPAEVPLLQLRLHTQSQSSRYPHIILLIQIIELIALIGMVFYLLFNHFPPKPVPTPTRPPPSTPGRW
ncbi:hypothetical protein BCIN_07g00190 [Botrytis cinerea B05.10]|uniref:Uncharacterized protein n=1 Tax=Botryotinia fuckeliana (strain B05.10) TaxID=332648 RepID=A0A384JLA5_BOTFB|nr:hypothetical protein BCIN_07g00190 [Botrytis cinerea B05.10]ATZ51375.1 hypothetical protein BCIN_07g00190 [Botrytis cinerea B05.10]